MFDLRVLSKQKMTGETPEVRSDRRKPREEREYEEEEDGPKMSLKYL